MIAAMGTRPSSRWLAALALAVALGLGAPAAAEDAPANDLLNAVLWMQRSVEYKATTNHGLRSGQDPSGAGARRPQLDGRPERADGRLPDAAPRPWFWTSTSRFLDNSAYQAWMTMQRHVRSMPKTWNAYVNTVTSLAYPRRGRVRAVRGLAGGVKVFYLSNRTAEEEPATRKNLEKLGFPMGGDVDTMLMTRKPAGLGFGQGNAPSLRRQGLPGPALLGDNFGDFADDYRGARPTG